MEKKQRLKIIKKLAYKNKEKLALNSRNNDNDSNDSDNSNDSNYSNNDSNSNNSKNIFDVQKERSIVHSSLKAPFQVILDTNFINDCIRKKIDLEQSLIEILESI